MEAFHKLTTFALRELAASLKHGAMSGGVTTHALQQIAGASLTQELSACLIQLRDSGWSLQHIADLVGGIADARGHASRPEELFDLVLSGPDVPGIPTRDTSTVMHTLIEQAKEEVLLVGYAVHNAKSLFQRLAQKMAASPELKVWFCLNIQRRPNDTSLSSEVVRRFATEFISKHWPWDARPVIYYDPRALDHSAVVRSSLHAKCLVIDRKEALVTSANFTEAAQKRNIEAGVVVRYSPFVQRLTSYFDALRESLLEACKLPVAPKECQ